MTEFDLTPAFFEAARLLAEPIHAMRGTRRTVRKSLRDRIGDRDGWVCCICGKPVDRALVWDKRRYGDPGWQFGANDMCPTLEHLIPVAVGGTNDPENLAIAHWICNRWHGVPDGEPAANAFLIRVGTAATSVLGHVERFQAGEFRDAFDDLWLIDHLRVLCEYMDGCGRAGDVPVLMREFYASADSWRQAAEGRRARQYTARQAASEEKWRLDWELGRAKQTLDRQQAAVAKVEARLASLKRPSAIERWTKERDRERRKLSRVRSRHKKAVQAVADHRAEAPYVYDRDDH